MNGKSDFLLLMLASENSSPIFGATRLMKMMYIARLKLKKKIRGVDFYQFYLHKYGPYSKELQDDISQLSIQDYIVEELVNIGNVLMKVYGLTEKGKEKVRTLKSQHDTRNIFEEIKSTYNNVSLYTLIRKVYSFPETRNLEPYIT